MFEILHSLLKMLLRQHLVNSTVTTRLNYHLSFVLLLHRSDEEPWGRSGDRIQVGGKFSAPVQTGPGAHPATCTMGTGSFLRVKSDRGVKLTPPHPFTAVVMKG